MPCESCGFANAEAARFCGGCGRPLTATCRSCEAPLTAGVRFCSNCGAPVGTATEGAALPASGPPSPPTTAAGAERRRISVMFVDLENFTSLAESLDPEEVRRVQSRYFEAARSVVASYGGTIEKFIGDAVMAVWGAPTAHEDDAERAVRAALGIVVEVSRLGGAVSDRGLEARAAVASGEAAVTIGAPEQGMVAGDMVNVAARLQPRAPAGGVLVDGATRELAPNAAAYESVGTLTLKGRTAGIAAHRARPLDDAAAGRVRGVHAGPFAGRDRELRELTGLYEAMVREGLSRLVSITGIAGIGKSRLAWEFGEWIERRPEAVAWHAGRAPAYGESITFAAVAEMVRRRIRVADDAPPGVVRRQLATTLSELVRDDEERRWMEPRVAVLLGRDEDHDFERDELFAAWRRFFERVSDRSPVVLVFEDLHWADPALLDFVEHLATWAREHRILIVALARPELLDRRPGWGAGVGRFTSINLDRLSDAAVRELLSDRAAGLPDAVVRTILDRAGGVPLYAVEVMRMLGSGPRPGGAIEVPDSLAGLIAARIDALPAAERRLLLSASVLGRRFRPEALAAVSGADAAVVHERADALVRRDLLTVDDELGSPGRGDMAFMQDLVRDVAFRTLGHDDRRALHIAAARYLEAREDDGAADALARHLLEAHRLAPTHVDAPRIARRAVAALRTAARDAMRLHVPERALRHLEHALEMTEAPAQRAVLLAEAATAARDAAQLDVAEALLRELVAHHGDGDAPAAARARAQLASVLLMAQRNEPALVELEAALAAIADPEADAGAAEVAAQLARARMLVGDDEAGVEWADRAIATAERLDVSAVAADAIVTRGTALVRLGRGAEGLAELDRAIGLAREGALLATELRARNNLAWLLVSDDPHATLANARAGGDLATTMGVGDMAVQLLEVACAAAIDTGDWEWALSTTAEITRGPVPQANRINLISQAAVLGAYTARRPPLRAFAAIQPLPPETDPQVASSVLYAQAWIAFLAGSLDEAQRLAAQAAVESFGAERSYQVALVGRAALWRGDRDAAAAAIGTFDGLPLTGRATRATSRTLAAGLAVLDGDSDPGAFTTAADAWRELRLPLPLALCLLDAQRLLGGAAAGRDELVATLRTLRARGLERLLAEISLRSGSELPARSHRPSAGTARRKDAARPPQPARRPPSPPG
jgi:class 3 adenylate cyclase